MTISISDSGNPVSTYSTDEFVSFSWTSSTDDPGTDGNIISTIITMSPDIPDEIVITNGVLTSTAIGQHFEVFTNATDSVKWIDFDDNFQTADTWSDVDARKDTINELYDFKPNQLTSIIYTYTVTATTDLGTIYSKTYDTTIINNWTPGRDLVTKYVQGENVNYNFNIIVDTPRLTITSYDVTV